MSQTAAFELLGERLGLGPKSRAAYVAIDLGTRQPTQAEAAILADWLGGYPADDPMAEAGTSDNLPVSAFLQRIDDLVAELQADRELIRELLKQLVPSPQYDVAAERADVQAGEERLAQELHGTTSTPPPPARQGRGGGSRPAAREGGTA